LTREDDIDLLITTIKRKETATMTKDEAEKLFKELLNNKNIPLDAKGKIQELQKRYNSLETVVDDVLTRTEKLLKEQQEHEIETVRKITAKNYFTTGLQVLSIVLLAVNIYLFCIVKL
jgi:archaellum component FlaC